MLYTNQYLRKDIENLLNEHQDHSYENVIVDGFSGRIMAAPRVDNEKDTHIKHAVQIPGRSLLFYKADEFEGIPKSWIVNKDTFFTVAPLDSGIWYAWGRNQYPLAFLPNMQGINPITGLPFTSVQLEQYKNECPKHKVKFESDRYCPKCKYHWPSQNYITDPNPKWWDGWRTEDGHLRQFFFTEKEERIVATKILKEKAPEAFGWAMFLPKNPNMIRGNEWKYVTNANDWIYYESSNMPPLIGSWNLRLGSKRMSFSSNMKISQDQVFFCNASNDSNQNNQISTYSVNASYQPQITTKTVGIGAGAEVKMELSVDQHDLDWWKEEPNIKVQIYFIHPDLFSKVMKTYKGKEIKKEGYLEGIEVG